MTQHHLNKKIINTTAAPAAIGPYSQAIQVGNMLFTSGQIALDTQGNMIGGNDVAMQTRQALFNLKTVVEAAGFTLAHVVKTTCFLKSMESFAAFNAIYAEYFGAHLPARECVEAARLPRDALVEVSAIAVST
jgi:2-iminobutanoate/2-iminopropanoate deaminase